jgi:hypothetical protein
VAEPAKLETVSRPRPSLLSVEGVAELLHVPGSWVYDRTRSRGVNRIPGFRLGKYWRFTRSTGERIASKLAGSGDGVDRDFLARWSRKR